MTQINTLACSNTSDTQSLYKDMYQIIFSDLMLAAESASEIRNYMLINKEIRSICKPFYNDMHAFYAYNRVTNEVFLVRGRTFRSDRMIHTEEELSSIRFITLVAFDKTNCVMPYSSAFFLWMRDLPLPQMDILHCTYLTNGDNWHAACYNVNRRLGLPSPSLMVLYKSCSIATVTASEEAPSAKATQKEPQQLIFHDCTEYIQCVDYNDRDYSKSRRLPSLKDVANIRLTSLYGLSVDERYLTLNEDPSTTLKEQEKSFKAYSLKMPSSTTTLTLSDMSVKDSLSFTIHPTSTLQSLTLIELRNFDLCSTIRMFCNDSMTLKSLRIEELDVRVTVPNDSLAVEINLPATLETLIMKYVNFSQPVAIMPSGTLRGVSIVNCFSLDYNRRNDRSKKIKSSKESCIDDTEELYHSALLFSYTEGVMSS